MTKKAATMNTIFIDILTPMRAMRKMIMMMMMLMLMALLLTLVMTMAKTHGLDFFGPQLIDRMAVAEGLTSSTCLGLSDVDGVEVYPSRLLGDGVAWLRLSMV